MVVRGRAGTGEAAEAPRDIVEFLCSLGATAQQIADTKRPSQLQQLAADLVLARAADFALEELARLSGVGVEDVSTIWRMLGVDTGRQESLTFRTDDVELIRSLARPDNFGSQGGDELLRVIGTALGRVADAAVSFYVQTIEWPLVESGASPLALAKGGAHAAEEALELGSGLSAIFRHHLQDAVRRQRLTQPGVRDPALARLGVGFVDLVGFTPMSHRMGTRELSTFVNDFETRAFEVASARGGRVVKHIGDEIMFVTPDPEGACQLAISLMNEFDGPNIQPHGGLCFGKVVTRHGDFYGRVVNLASRLTELAIPGEVLTDASVSSGLETTDLVFESAGRRQIKGFDEPVQVFSIRTQT